MARCSLTFYHSLFVLSLYMLYEIPSMKSLYAAVASESVSDVAFYRLFDDKGAFKCANVRVAVLHSIEV